MQRFIPKRPSMHGPPNGKIKRAMLLGITCNTDTRRKTGSLFLSTQVSFQQIKQRTSRRLHKLGNSSELHSAKSFHEKAGRGQDTFRFFLSVSLFPFS